MNPEIMPQPEEFYPGEPQQPPPRPPIDNSIEGEKNETLTDKELEEKKMPNLPINPPLDPDDSDIPEYL